MKYFGYLKDISIEGLGERELAEYFIKEGLFKSSYKTIFKGFKDGVLDLTIDTSTLIVEPTDDLLNDFYNFIMCIYSYEISYHKLTFFNAFNDEIFGLKKTAQQKIGLSHFKTIYNDIYQASTATFDEKESKNGVIHTLNASKLKMLDGRYQFLKTNLFNKIKINKYLKGDKEYFEKENLSKLFNLEDEINFEIQLQILVELNDRFNFEEDLYFTKIRFDKEKFQTYSHIFKSLEAYQFTNNKIKTFNIDHKAHIESLYEVLNKKDLIFNHKENFIRFINEEYNLSLSKIISYDEKTNYKHDERVELFMSDWSKMTAKN
jgi:hypothetical protein